MDMLAAHGYAFEWRKNILRKAMTGYRRILMEVSQEGTRRNRRGWDTMRRRRVKEICGKTIWYQKIEDEEEELDEGGEYEVFQRDGILILMDKVGMFLMIHSLNIGPQSQELVMS